MSFSDGGKVLRKSTEIKIASRTTQAFEKSQAAARQREALIKAEYFKEKDRDGREGRQESRYHLRRVREEVPRMGGGEGREEAKHHQLLQATRSAILRSESLKNTMLSRVDEERIADDIQWRSKTTVMVAHRGNNGKITMADTYRPIKVATVNSDIRTIRRILNIARDWHYWVKPLQLRVLAGEERRDRVISHDEERTYLATAPQLLRDFATIGVDTGLRPLPNSALCARSMFTLSLPVTPVSAICIFLAGRRRTQNATGAIGRSTRHP